MRKRVETAESTRVALAERDAQIAERDARIAELINSMNGDISRRESTTDEISKALVEACVEIKILRRVHAESSRRPPRYRRDDCSMAWRCRFLTARPSQDGRVIAEK